MLDQSTPEQLGLPLDGATCARCGETKPRDAFPTNKAKKNGLGSWCRECCREYQREYRREYDKTETYRAYRREYDRNRKLLDPEFAERSREAQRAYREKRAAANPKWQTEKRRKWATENPDAARLNTVVQTMRRRYSYFNAEGRVTAADIRTVLERDGYRCLACNSPEKLCIDHVVPLSKGGTNLLDNLQTLCNSCNVKKRDKTVDYRS